MEPRGGGPLVVDRKMRHSGSHVTLEPIDWTAGGTLPCLTLNQLSGKGYRWRRSWINTERRAGLTSR